MNYTIETRGGEELHNLRLETAHYAGAGEGARCPFGEWQDYSLSGLYDHVYRSDRRLQILF